MALDSGDRDYYSPEEKHRLNAEWRDSEAGRSLYKEIDKEERKAGVGRAIVWLAMVILVLVVGTAIVKWALEELAK